MKVKNNFYNLFTGSQLGAIDLSHFARNILVLLFKRSDDRIDESSYYEKGEGINMQKAFTIKGVVFQFSDEDVKRAAAIIKLGVGDRVRFFTKVDGKPYSVRQLLVEMVKQKGTIMPDATTHEAIRVLRALGFEIVEG
jgi:hypothetical protein